MFRLSGFEINKDAKLEGYVYRDVDEYDQNTMYGIQEELTKIRPENLKQLYII